MTRLAIVLALAGCHGHGPTAPIGSRIAPALTAALAAADTEREPWPCGGDDAPGAAAETLEAGGVTWQVSGHALTLGGDARELAIGVIADAAGSAPATLAALGRLRGKLGKVDVVLALGGMGASRAELEAVYAALADRATWPVVALPGDLEPAAGQGEAIAAGRQRGLIVLDGRLIHRVELPGATIALVPGAGAASRLVAGSEGCSYRGDDVTAALTDLTPRPGLRILASAEAPRGVDASGEPTGDLALTAGAGQELDLALHGGAGEASPARTGNRDAAAVSISPGPSDATPRLPGPRRAASAGVLTVHGNAWTWRPIEDGK